jgi:hypothetical protein
MQRPQALAWTAGGDVQLVAAQEDVSVLQRGEPGDVLRRGEPGDVLRRGEPGDVLVLDLVPLGAELLFRPTRTPARIRCGQPVRRERARASPPRAVPISPTSMAT